MPSAEISGARLRELRSVRNGYEHQLALLDRLADADEYDRLLNVIERTNQEIHELESFLAGPAKAPEAQQGNQSASVRLALVEREQVYHDRRITNVEERTDDHRDMLRVLVTDQQPGGANPIVVIVAVVVGLAVAIGASLALIILTA